MSELPTAERRKLGEMLVAAGVLDENQLQAALAEQQHWGEPLGRTLVQMGVLSEDIVVRALSRQLGIPACDPASIDLPPGMAGYIGLHLVEQFGVMPVAVDAEKRVLHVATSDPTDKRALAELGSHIGWSIQPVVASATRIEQAIRKHYFGESDAVSPSSIRNVAPQATSTPAPVSAEPAGAAAASPALFAAELAALQGSTTELERLAGGQLRALRVLVEMLVERGVIKHEDYIARVRGNEPGGK